MNDTETTFHALRPDPENKLGLGIKRMGVRTHLSAVLSNLEIQQVIDFLQDNYPDMMNTAARADGIEALAKKYHREMHPQNTTLEDCSYSTCGFFMREIDALAGARHGKGE